MRFKYTQSGGKSQLKAGNRFGSHAKRGKRGKKIRFYTERRNERENEELRGRSHAKRGIERRALEEDSILRKA